MKKPYSKNREPILYAAFSEKDRAKAMPVIERLSERCKVYYTSTYGKKDRKTLSKAAAYVLFFGGGSSDEMTQAAEAAASSGRGFIPVFFDDTKLPESLLLLLGSNQWVEREKYASDEDFEQAILESPVLSSMKITDGQKKAAKRTVLFSVLAVMLAAAVAVPLIIFNPFAGKRIDPDSTLGKLGLSGGVNSVRNVYLYGEKLYKKLEKNGAFAAGALTNDGQPRLYLPVADEFTDRGTLTDISEFSELVNLRELSLCGASVRDISSLAGLEKLKLLDLSYQHALNGAETDSFGLSLSGISRLASLETLYMIDTIVTDGFDELDTMPSFKKLVTTRYTLEDSGYDFSNVKYEIVYVDTLVGNYEEFKAALNDSSVHLIRIEKNADISVPEADTLTVRADCRVSGDSFKLKNYGTVRIYGSWETGLAKYENHGKLTVESGGFLSGGMKDTYNFGSVIIEAGGIHELERGNHFIQESGDYTVRGTLGIWIGGSFEYNGGTLHNEGLIRVAHDEDFDWYSLGSFENTMNFARSFEGKGEVEEVKTASNTQGVFE